MSEQKHLIDVSSEEFADIIISAVRYALPRTTHIVSDTIDFVIPIIPYLSRRALFIISLDITKSHCVEEWNGLYQACWRELYIRGERKE